MTDFFRPEVVLHRQRGGVGSIRLVRPVSMTLLTAVVVALAIAVGAWLATGSYTRTVRLEGCLAIDPGGGLRAELFAPAATFRLLRVGQSVRLRSPVSGSQPATPFFGTILGVSRGPVTAGELPGLPASIARRATNDALYRATVGLDGGLPPDRVGAGSAVEGDVRLDRRRLVDGLFAPRDDAVAPA